MTSARKLRNGFLLDPHSLKQILGCVRSEEEGRRGEAGGEQEWLSTPTPAACPGLNRQVWVHHSLAQNPLSLSGAKPLPGFGDPLICCSPSSATHLSHPAAAAISDQQFSTRFLPSRVSNKEVVLPHLVAHGHGTGAWFSIPCPISPPRFHKLCCEAGSPYGTDLDLQFMFEFTTAAKEQHFFFM